MSDEIKPIPPAPAQVGDAHTAPTTTAAQEATNEGQRKVNLIWENTQRLVALSVVWCGLFVAACLCLINKEVNVTLASMVFLYGVANLVIGFYFGRTNHTRVGGVGEKSDKER